MCVFRYDWMCLWLVVLLWGNWCWTTNHCRAHSRVYVLLHLIRCSSNFDRWDLIFEKRPVSALLISLALTETPCECTDIHLFDLWSLMFYSWDSQFRFFAVISQLWDENVSNWKSYQRTQKPFLTSIHPYMVHSYMCWSHPPAVDNVLNIEIFIICSGSGVVLLFLSAAGKPFGPTIWMNPEMLIKVSFTQSKVFISFLVL